MPPRTDAPPPYRWLMRGLLATAGLILALLALRLAAGWNADCRRAAAERSHQPLAHLRTDASGGVLSVAWTYDGLGRQRTEQMVGAGQSAEFNYADAYTYDLAGNRLKLVRAAGGATATTRGTFDAADRLRATASDAGTPANAADDVVTAYTYATSGGADTGQQRGVTVAAAGAVTSTTSYGYDVMGRLSRAAVAEGGDDHDRRVRLRHDRHPGGANRGRRHDRLPHRPVEPDRLRAGAGGGHRRERRRHAGRGRGRPGVHARCVGPRAGDEAGRGGGGAEPAGRRPRRHAGDARRGDGGRHGGLRLHGGRRAGRVHARRCPDADPVRRAVPRRAHGAELQPKALVRPSDGGVYSDGRPARPPC